MKSIVVAGGISVFLSFNENELLEKYDYRLNLSELTDRDRYIASQLLHRGVLKHANANEGRMLILNQNKIVKNNE